MLGWAVTLLIIALVAGLLGFGLVGGMAYEVAKIYLCVSLVIFIVSLLMERRPTV